MPHGGPSARDEWGFDWLAQYFANRGYAVLQPNYRGSAGYGDDWFQKNGFQSWRTAIGDVNDAGRWLVSQGIADPAKLGDLRLVLWRLCGAPVRRRRSGAVQGRRRGRAGHRPRPAARPRCASSPAIANARDFIGDGPHIARGLAGPECGEDQGAGAALPRRPGPQRPDPPVAADARPAAGCRAAGRAGRAIRASTISSRTAPPAHRLLRRSDAFLRQALRHPDKKKGGPARPPFQFFITGRPISASRTRRPGSAPCAPDRAPRRASERG